MVKKNHVVAIRKILSRLAFVSQRGLPPLCAQMWVRGKEKVWVQAQLGCVNFAYPFPGAPDRRLRDLGIKSLPEATTAEWESYKFATISFESSVRISDIARFVHELFIKLHDSSQDYELMIETFTPDGKVAPIKRFQVVVQLPAAAVSPAELVAKHEGDLARGIGELGEVDGNDYGAESVNYFVLTTQPLETFDLIVPWINAQPEKLRIRVAYRDKASDTYVNLWPPGASSPFTF